LLRNNLRLKINFFQKIGRKFSFTEVETKVVFFLLVLLFVGIFSVYLKESGSSFEIERYDYSQQDSIFHQKGISPEKMMEKSVDSERELLDFTADEKEPETKTEPVLGEKSININTADIKLLSLLPGIGVKTAEKIVELRNSIGKFTSTRDLLKVKGIGDKKFSKLEKYIIVE
jgi:competence ComEA-like helix-hairpin-helix protein